MPTITRGLVRPGDGLNLRCRVVAGEEGRDDEEDSGGDDSEVGLMLTDTGLDRGSCLSGSLSGGPIVGLESRLRLRFFSSLLLLLLSSRLRFFELLLRSLLRSSEDEDDLEAGLVMAVMVMELGSEAWGRLVSGMISMPGLRSRPMLENIELKLLLLLLLLLFWLLLLPLVMGVMLTDGDTKLLLSSKTLAALNLLLSSARFLNFLSRFRASSSRPLLVVVVTSSCTISASS